MRTFIDRTIHAKTVSDTKGVKCDLCNRGNLTNSSSHTHSWDSYQCMATEYTYFEHSKSVCDWVNSIRTTTSFDICPKCFADKLLPLMEREFGLKPQVVEINENQRGLS